MRRGGAKLTDDELKARRDALPQPPPFPKPESDTSSKREEQAEFRKLFAFLRDEGSVAYRAPTRGTGGTMLATGPLGEPGIEPPPPPGFNLTAESYNRIVRLMKRDVPARLEVRSRVGERVPRCEVHTNVIAELPGREKPEEIVVAGAHLDS